MPGSRPAVCAPNAELPREELRIERIWLIACQAAVLTLALGGCAMMGASSGGWTILVDWSPGLDNFVRVGEAN